MIVPAVGAKTTPPLTVRLPATLKEADGWVDGVPAIVNPLNVRVPLLTILQAVPVNVVVPVGAKITPLFTVSVPATLNEPPDCTDGVPAIVILLNTGVPVTLHAVPDMVTVPLNVPPAIAPELLTLPVIVTVPPNDAPAEIVALPLIVPELSLVPLKITLPLIVPLLYPVPLNT